MLCISGYLSSVFILCSTEVGIFGLQWAIQYASNIGKLVFSHDVFKPKLCHFLTSNSDLKIILTMRLLLPDFFLTIFNKYF